MSEKKTVVITGGAKGIGASISKVFVERGYYVLIGSRQDHGFAVKLGERTRFQKTDVRKPKDLEKLAQSAVKWTGQLDVFINNAGHSRWRPVAKVTEKFWDQMVDTKGIEVCGWNRLYLGTAGNDGLILAWTEPGNLYCGTAAQYFDDQGNALHEKIVLAQSNSAANSEVSGTRIANGWQLLVWAHDPVTAGRDIFGQLLGQEGAKKADAFTVNTFLDGVQRKPSSAAQTGGKYVVGWQGATPPGGDWRISFQRYDPQGEVLGVNSMAGTSPSAPTSPAAAAFGDGSFVFVWNQASANSQDVYAQRFDIGGNKLYR